MCVHTIPEVLASGGELNVSFFVLLHSIVVLYIVVDRVSMDGTRPGCMMLVTYHKVCAVVRH